VLFVEPPTEEVLRQFPNVRAIGVAGQSRIMSPAEMDAQLAHSFRALKELQPKFVHYKVCSTFDSSPEIGSIGRAIELGQNVFQNRFVPLVVGSPSLQRFCVFGNLFARSGLASDVFRLDRHPTMRHHPVTPMSEADLREHLSRQTNLPSGLVNVIALKKGFEAARTQLSQSVDSGAKIVLFDTLTDEHLATIGKLITSVQEQEGKPLFVAGSSGVDYALTKHWRSTSGTPQMLGTVKRTDRILAVSGSCSPVTGRQINWALDHDFADFALNSGTQINSSAQSIIAALRSGRSAILHTCCGPNDPRLNSVKADASNLGIMLGKILSDVVKSRCVHRVAIFGGDTSGQVAHSLGIDALEYVGPLEPGAPLCRVRSRHEAVNGLEIVFKGGQVGYDNFLNTVLKGRSD
jgi:uncharacterized protein YgbK (DUF1537 family)